MNIPTPPLAGIFVAALTPLLTDFLPDLEAIPGFLSLLAARGCHGALILGTTGEGPSFSWNERRAIYQAAVMIRQAYPQFKLLAGTGTPSLEETVSLTRLAFELGYDGVTVLPPYYFRKVSEDGLFAWFSQVIQRSVPSGMPLLYYHFPANTGINISCNFLGRLLTAFPGRFAGIKDSSGDVNFARQLGSCFGKDLAVFTGNDRLLTLCLNNQGSGSITAMANLYSPLLRKVWDAHLASQQDDATQDQIGALRTTLEGYAPFPPILKGLVAQQFHLPPWPVRPPLLPANLDLVNQARQELAKVE